MRNSDDSNKRMLFRLFLIAVGIIWILIKLNIIPPGWSDILISWQMLLIGIGRFSFIGGNRTSGTFLIVIGVFFLAEKHLIIPYELRQIGWPILIIGIGLALLLTRNRKHTPVPVDKESTGTEYFDDFVIFGGREILINSRNFLGGKITSIFGGAEYDLRQTILSDNGAVIDCVCIFGGSGFKILPDWTVKNEISTIFGAFTDKRGMLPHERDINPSKTLVLKGFSAFGGVEVKFG